MTEDTGSPPPIHPATSDLTPANRRDHFLARWGYKRSQHRVDPGLYSIGNPTEDSPVFVTSNYTLSFDALRSAIPGIDGYILVLDTEGVNVWCAAGKGTFGTDELVHRIEAARLKNVVSHRRLILPQLGAPGVAAHEVKKRSSFKVEYGPVRAADLPEYLANGRRATPEMRRVQFTLRDRLVLIPVEVVSLLIPLLVASLLLWSIAPAAAILAGAVLFPALIPWLPTHDFSTKGYILGFVVALPFTLWTVLSPSDAVWWLQAGKALVYLLAMPSVTAFIALNFTGATTFTSPSGVRREIFRYFPIMVWTFVAGLVLLVATKAVAIFGG